MRIFDITVPLGRETHIWDDGPAPALEFPLHLERGDFATVSNVRMGSHSGTHTDAPVHRTLMEAGIVLLEGTDLREVPVGTYLLVCAPLKLEGAEGAPTRAFLIAED